MDETTTKVAVAAVTSPLWLHYLQAASEVAGTLLPIFGVVWLLVQIAVKLWDTYRNRKNPPTE